ncbi:MAG: methyltransferase [Spirochaetes bacterium]|nr:methyltransferase [Spirochaetota bacterium]
MKRHNIQLPPTDTDCLDQDKAYFNLVTENEKVKFRFHDYNKIYSIPGLYEQLFYDRLKCNSPKKVTEALRYTIDQNKEHFSELKVLDFGAGNGMMGEELKKVGIARLVGADILQEAKDATERDRPGTYDEYFVKDFTRLSGVDKEEIRSWNLNSLTTVAALGFGDIPPLAFVEALNLIHHEGWVAFNIKETFFYTSDNSGFSKLIRELIFSEYLNINHLERYRHRISIQGKPLFYFSVVCWKRADISLKFLKKKGIM